jgi:hypothetical protein
LQRFPSLIICQKNKFDPEGNEIYRPPSKTIVERAEKTLIGIAVNNNSRHQNKHTDTQSYQVSNVVHFNLPFSRIEKVADAKFPQRRDGL